jgi:hypothetical protein
LIEFRKVKISMKLYLAPRRLDVASWICILGNNFVESSSENVLIRITVNPRQASQRYPRETTCESTINPVIQEWRKQVNAIPKW